MEKHCKKNNENVYFRYRKQAAKIDDRLNSRAGAAELLDTSESSVTAYELGNVKVVPVDIVHLMAEVYRAPELRYYYCRNECPLGKCCVPEIEVQELDRLTLRVLGSLRKIEFVAGVLIDIMDDGKITPDEHVSLFRIIETLDRIATHVPELKIWVEKNLE